MMRLVGSLSPYYKPRIYVLAESDRMSAEKIVNFEKIKTDRSSSEVWCVMVLCIPNLIKLSASLDSESNLCAYLLSV